MISRKSSRRLLLCSVVFLVWFISALPQSGGTVSGRLLLPDGKPAAGVRVGAMAVSLQGKVTDATLLDSLTETDSNGRYRLSSISPGRYYVVAGALAAPTYHPGTGIVSEATILTVMAGSNATAVDFTIPRMPPETIQLPMLTGKVVTEDGSPPPFFLGTLYIDASGLSRTTLGADGGKIRGSGTYGAIPVGRTGAFSMMLPDGEYTLSLINSAGDPLYLTDGYDVKSMTFGTTDILGRTFRVAGNPRPTVLITITKR